MVYRFQIACMPENIQSIKKYQRVGDKRLSGSVQQKTRIASTGRGPGESEVLGHQEH